MDRSSQVAWLVVEKLASRGGNFSLVLRRFLQKYEPLSLANFTLAVKECLPGVDEDEIRALSVRLDDDGDGILQIDDLCRLFQTLKRDTVLPGNQPKTCTDDDRIDVLLAKMHGRLSTLATEQHARIPSSKRLPARKEQLLRALGLRALRNAFDAVRRSKLVKLTPAEMGRAVNHFRTPGQGLLVDHDDVRGLWKLCDSGDPEKFIEIYRNYLKKESKSKKTIAHPDLETTVKSKDKQRMRAYTHASPDEGGPDNTILKLRYKQSRTLVSPPVGFRKRDLAKAVSKSFKAPSFGLELEHVFGYTPDLAGPNLAAARDKIIYNSAAVAVVTGGTDQVFFRGHSDDVACIAIDSKGVLGATGQVASETTQPYACVWSVEDGRELRKFGGDGSIQRLVCAVSFFRDGSHLAVVSGDDRHTVYAYDLRKEDAEPVMIAPCKSGVKPPAVWAVCAAPKLTCERFGHDHVLVTLGVGHLAFWLIDLPTMKTGGRRSLSFSKKLPTYQNRKSPSATHCCAFVPNDDAVVTGASDGKVYVWRDYTVACCFDAHRGPTRAMAHASTWLYTGGQDGLVKRWDLVRGKYRAVVDSYHNAANPHAKHSAGENHAKHQSKSYKGPSAFESQRRTSERGVSDLIVDPRDESLAICGFAFGEIAVVDVARKANVRVVQRAHHASTSDVCAHPTKRAIFATVGLDCLLCVWNADQKALVASTSLCAAGMAVAMNERYVAVGLATGAVSVHDQEILDSTVMTANVSLQSLSQIRYSPDNTRLAIGSHDCCVYILDASNLAVRRKLGGHSSYVTHLDFSADSKLVQSSCGGYEILYWDVARGKQVNSSHDSVESDTDWYDWTLTLGFPVMGIFEPDSDGTDVNCVHRAAASNSSRKDDLIVTGDDSGYVNIYNAPAVCRHAAHFQYTGHSSHCVGARFLKGGDRVVTTGGRDAAVFVWRVVSVTSTNEDDHKLIQPPIARPAWIKGCDMTSSTDILRKPSKLL